MSKVKWIAIGVGSIALAGTVACLGDIIKKNGAPPPSISIIKTKVEKRPVTASAEKLKTPEYFQASGKVFSRKITPIKSSVSGHIAKIYVQEGTIVKENEPLIQLEVQTKGHNIQELKERANALQASSKQAQKEAMRKASLLSQGLATNEEFQRAEELKNELFSRLKATEGALNLKQKQLQDATINAPHEGEVTKQATAKGAWVEENTPLLLLSSLHDLVINTEVPDYIAERTDREKPVLVSLPAENSHFEGIIIAVSPGENDPEQRKVQIAFTSSIPIAKGQIAHALLPMGTRERLVVPAGAVDYEEERPFVTVFERGQSAVRYVTIGREYGTVIEVFFGLKEGEEVILTP